MELLDGMAMDVTGRTYRTPDDTLSYSYHVAGVVGVMMAMIMGVRDRPTLERASDLGIAFQLTNIARDVLPDAAVGRLYLPADWLAAHDVPANPAAVTDPRHRAGVVAVTGRLLDLADDYYHSAEVGLATLPLRSAWAIAAARRIYREIGRVVRRRGAAAWDTRSGTSRTTKVVGVGLAGLEAMRATATGPRPQARSRDGLWTPPALGDG